MGLTVLNVDVGNPADPEVTEELEFLIPIVNGNRETHDYKIQNQDHIWITLPIGGGS